MSGSSLDRLVANTVRGLAMDAVQAADSGHPGMPMGMADIATALWTRHVKYDPTAPDWADRDRFVLSNGHGSMLLYSMLYLTGTSLTLEDLRQFRQWGSRTAGHPEYGEAPGIETTTGPLGQGVANAVGMALAERWLNARFGDELVDHHTWVLCGDGCLMEGISSEAGSLAGHLGLGKLIVLYDDNHITIDGSTDLSFSEDVAARFAAFGWHVVHADGHDADALDAAMSAAKAETARPSLICCRTVIGFGSPHLAGQAKTHGSPLGAAEIALTKAALGLDPDASFQVPDGVIDHVRAHDGQRRADREAWEARLAAHADRARWDRFHAAPSLDDVQWPEFVAGTKIATRKAGEAALKALAASVENLLGGSADLAGSNGSYIKGGGDVSATSWGARNLNFGVREHAMASLCNGMVLHGGIIPYCATFLVFHDYMRPAVRLAALMKQPVTYLYTHDSIHVGEDGPTHQPIEHLMSMRAMPNLWVVRPADGTETVEAYKLALARRDGPTALCLSRQNLTVLDREALAPASGVQRGGYVLSDVEGAAVVLIGTGSEVGVALAAQALLAEAGVAARVVSLPCWELFFAQDADYRRSVLPAGLPRVSVEAGCTFGWERVLGDNGVAVGIDRFGASAPGSVVADKLGVSAAHVAEVARSLIAGG